MKNKKDPVIDMLQDAINTRTSRNKSYANPAGGEAYKVHGAVIKTLFPNGIKANTEDEINRLMNINVIVGKLIRYCANYDSGGHDDSMRDIAVYSQMQRELDQIEKEK